MTRALSLAALALAAAVVALAATYPTDPFPRTR